MTPDEWLTDFEAKTAELQRNAAAVRRNLESAGQTVTSDDKTLTVTVVPNGAGSGLRQRWIDKDSAGAFAAASNRTRAPTTSHERE